MNVTPGRRALVTGGAGFLGSHMCDRLLSEQYHVICLDNLLTGSLDNIKHLMDTPNFEFVKHDICEPFEAEVDEIYNFACAGSPPQYQADPVHTLKTSVYGVANLLELARRTGAKLFQASTSEVYGDPEVHPQVETYRGSVNIIGPRACYDEGKRCAETLCFDFHRIYGVKIKVARIFNTYGPRMHPLDGRVVSNFIVQALKGDPITIYGNGSQTRSFCYVDDLIDGILRLMNSPDDFTGPVNLGNPSERTVAELAQLVVEMTGSKSPIIYRPLPPDDPRRRRPDITLARTQLGWFPSTSIQTGLARTIAYFQASLKKELV